MEFTEMQKRMLYQTEGCERYAVINELSMASQYAGDPARRKAAKDLMEKLRPLSDAGCMGLVRDIQKNTGFRRKGGPSEADRGGQAEIRRREIESLKKRQLPGYFA